ncbi:MAG: ABC transporter substrate-binding protein [Clostridiales bacterium]|nr:ABC transporter substrate-binding protein [Clostridiales bacterium]
MRKIFIVFTLIVSLILALSGCEPEGAASEDGEYLIAVTLEGGSGRAFVASPALLTVNDGQAFARIVWSSSHYDYMMVDGEKYFPVNTEGNSVFEIPVAAFDEPLAVTADTTAMGAPHEIAYTLTFDSESILEAGDEGSDRGFVPEHSDDANTRGSRDDGLSRREQLLNERSPADQSLADQSRVDQSLVDQSSAERPFVSASLTYAGSMELVSARQFSVDYYDYEGQRCALVTIAGGACYLVVPEAMTVPGDLAADIVVLHQPVKNGYLVASAAMDMFVSLDAVNAIRFSGLKADSWYIEEARTAMEAGDIRYAGNYSAPDYEQLLAQDCDLAIENTMIYHTPEVKEQLERLGVPVLVDCSSYETEPLGRVEWVKLYGLLTGKETEAEAAFDTVQEEFSAIDRTEAAGKTVAFFYITANGEIHVRRGTDYLVRLMELAGGDYIFDDLGTDTEGASSTVTLQMEEFYAAVRDADYLIYNSTIEGELAAVDQLLEKSLLFSGFRAVQSGQVYCTKKNLYQSSMALGTIAADLHSMLMGEDQELNYFYKLE